MWLNHVQKGLDKNTIESWAHSIGFIIFFLFAFKFFSLSFGVRVIFELPLQRDRPIDNLVIKETPPLAKRPFDLFSPPPHDFSFYNPIYVN